MFRYFSKPETFDINSYLSDAGNQHDDICHQRPGPTKQAEDACIRLAVGIVVMFQIKKKNVILIVALDLQLA